MIAKNTLITFILVLLHQVTYSQDLKNQLISEVELASDTIISIADHLWSWAEPSYAENRSSAYLIEILRKNGFSIVSNAGGLSTQFVATYGLEGPVIGLYAEYDADKGASNTVNPYRDPVGNSKYGHGGHHNLLAAGSVGAALILKNAIERGQLNGRLKIFGTTDEGGKGGKVRLAHTGFFDDLDFSLYWHPSPVTAAVNHSWDSMFEFRTLLYPEQGGRIHQDRSFNVNQQFEDLKKLTYSLRDSINADIRVNYTLETVNPDLQQHGDSLSVRWLLQHYDQAQNAQLFELINQRKLNVHNQARLQLIRAIHQFKPNQSAQQLVNQNIELLGPNTYSDNERQFVKQFARNVNSKSVALNSAPIVYVAKDKNELYGYSSDIGDASWFAPEAYFVVNTLPRGVAMHQWEGTIFSGHSIGHKGALYAAKILVATICDYLTSKDFQAAIRHDFELNISKYRYQKFN